MYKSLQLSSEILGGQVILDNLGQINIVCGKNNSGKSTVLSTIHSPNSFNDSTCLPCRRIDDEVLEIIGSNTGPSHQMFPRFLRQVCQGLSYLSRDIIEQIITKARIDASYHDAGIDIDPARRVLHELVGDNSHSVLVPNVRNFEIVTLFDATLPVSSGGSHLVNYLFASKNFDESHPRSLLLQKISSAFEEITQGYCFATLMSEQTANTISLFFRHGSTAWVPADKCGMGMRDLLILLYHSIATEAKVVLIEEPESHMHPEMQRRLLFFLREQTEKQFFLATHSQIFLNPVLVDRIFFTKFDGIVKIEDATHRVEILDDLGYSVADNLTSDMVILVEGPSDVPVLETFLYKMGILKDYCVKFWSLGGDCMGEVDLSVFSDYCIVALIDEDIGSSRSRQAFKRKCNTAGIHCHQLKRSAIENYFTLRALKEIFKAQIGEDIQDLDPRVKLEKQIGIDVKRNNRRIAEATTLQEIEQTDDLYGFLMHIKATLASQ